MQMGRPKKYANPAERQAAHRAKVKEQSVTIDRRQIEQLDAQLVQLHNAITKAADSGNPTAQQCRAASIGTTLDKLTKYFEASW
jgi:small-conductance mechanosensitive channel